MNWFVFPLLEEGGNNLESILLISPVADLSDPVSPLQGTGMQIYHSFSGCKNHSALHGGMRYSLICPLGLQTQQVPTLRQIPNCYWGEG
jgi:hypothetical protein